MDNRKYHGWIYTHKESGMNDSFTATYRQPDGTYFNKFTGYSSEGAAKAVEFFEIEKGLGPIKLESTPIGLRVFTESTDETV